jgi:hypothetical protein
VARDFTTTTILAEEIRPELGNKHSLLGVYSGNILVDKFPAVIRLGIFIVFDFVRPGPHNVEMRMSLDKELVTQGTTQVIAEPGKTTVIVAPIGMLGAEKPSELRIDAAVDGGKRFVLTRKRLLLSAPSAPSPPSEQSQPAPKRIRRRP